MRYKESAICPHCGSKKTYHRGVSKNFDCKACNNTFSIFTNTIFYKSKTDLRKWFYAIHLFLNSKKGISGYQLQREIGVTYKTAWRMLKQIRSAMGNENGKDDDNNGKMIGVVEIDEAYFGGNETNKHMSNRIKNGVTKKEIVVGMINRITKEVRAFTIESANRFNLTKAIRLNIDTTSTLITDGYNAYKKISNRGYEHKTVNHSMGEYVSEEDIHTNTIESFWATLKRGIYGVYHSVSRKYLQLYINEFSFRYNNKNNLNVFDALIKNCVNV
jgi:transposase-like protein